MLLQRLTKDSDCGFNYDYMGYAEYENGATANGRVKLAETFVDGQLVARRINFHGVPVLALGSEAIINEIGAVFNPSISKTGFRVEDPKIVAWIQVGWFGQGFEPLLMVRLSLGGEEISARVQSFLDRAIDHVKSEAS